MAEFSITITLGIIAGLTSLIASLFVISKKKISQNFLYYIISLGAGFILATFLFDMMPEAIEASNLGIFYIALGYFIINFFEHVFSPHFHFGQENHKNEITKKTAWAILVAFTIHTFLDGLAIGAGFNINYLTGFAIFTAVILHKIPDGLTIASVMLAAGRNKMGALAASSVLALATVVGSFYSATFVQFNDLFIGLSAGAFLHIAFTDLIPEVIKKRNLGYSLVIVLGALLYWVSSEALIKLGVG